MEKYTRLDAFLKARLADIYPEPESDLHVRITGMAIDHLASAYGVGAGWRVLDAGCGQGLALKKFRDLGIEPVGLTFGEDLEVCRADGFEVHEMDQSFLDFAPGSFDLVWSRHCLEHSIFPYFTLSEFFRVLKPGGLAYVEVPAPDTAGAHETNPNHYSVIGRTMWLELFRRTGYVVEETRDIGFAITPGQELYLAFFLRKPDAAAAAG